MSDFFDSPVFVLGLPRSGTSMIAGALAVCGVWVGRSIPGGVDNARGFFENYTIREVIIKKMLTDLDCDPLGVKLLPPVDLNLEIEGLDLIIREVIENDGYLHDTSWLYKDAKLTLLWPLFVKAFPRARWVIVRRDDESIINSCLSTRFMKHHSSERVFWEMFIKAYMKRLERLKISGVDYREIWMQDVIHGGSGAMRELVDWLQLDFNQAALDQFISPDLCHNSSKDDIGSGY